MLFSGWLRSLPPGSAAWFPRRGPRPPFSQISEKGGGWGGPGPAVIYDNAAARVFHEPQLARWTQRDRSPRFDDDGVDGPPSRGSRLVAVRHPPSNRHPELLTTPGRSRHAAREGVRSGRSLFRRGKLAQCTADNARAQSTCGPRGSQKRTVLVRRRQACAVYRLVAPAEVVCHTRGRRTHKEYARTRTITSS